MIFGAEKHVGKELDNDLGTSVIMLNSQKGMTFYEGIRNKFKEEPISLEAILPGNKALQNSLSKPKIDRDSLYEDLENMPFKSLQTNTLNYLLIYLKRRIN